MQLQTKIKLPEGKLKINYDSKIGLLGSCFSENMGERFAYYQFPNLQNPFGILFHPFAIERLLKNIVEEKKYTEEDIFLHQEMWHCFDAHSKMSAADPKKMLMELNVSLAKTRDFLQSATHLIITLGTSFVYQFKETGDYVANCHKLPQHNFDKELSASAEIQQSIQQIISYAQQINPEIKLVFTISPVRHVKEGLIENQRSKANLIAGLHEAMATEKTVSYFPSYEIQLDELRDYRFYAEDLLHPNKTAIQYIWEKFLRSWLDPQSVKVMEKVETVQRDLQHRAFAPESDAHQQFLKRLQQKIEQLQEEFPFMRFPETYS